MESEELLKIRKRFAKNAKPFREERSGSHNSYGAFIHDDGKMHTVGKWVCHGWLQSGSKVWSSTRGPIKYILSAVMSLNEGISKEQAILYIDWLINRSPWASIFVDKDPESVYELGYLVDADNNSTFIVSAMIATRFLTEAYVSPDIFPLRNKLYFQLVGAGVPEIEAFLLCHYYTGSKGSVFPVKFSPMGTGHSVFCGYNYDKDYFKNFLSGSFTLPDSRTVRQQEGYHGGVFKLWGEGKGVTSFRSTLMGIRPSKFSTTVDLNIFRKVRQDSVSYDTIEDFIDVLQQLKGIVNA